MIDGLKNGGYMKTILVVAVLPALVKAGASDYKGKLGQKRPWTGGRQDNGIFCGAAQEWECEIEQEAWMRNNTMDYRRNQGHYKQGQFERR